MALRLELDYYFEVMGHKKQNPHIKAVEVRHFGREGKLPADIYLDRGVFYPQNFDGERLLEDISK